MAILITGGTDASAYRLNNILGYPGEVFFADCVPMPSTKHLTNRFLQIPSGTASSFAHDILEICLTLNIAAVYPLRKNEHLPLAESFQLFGEFGIKVFAPPKYMLDQILRLPMVNGELVVIEHGQVVNGKNLFTNFPADCTGVYLVNKETGYSIFAID